MTRAAGVCSSTLRTTRKGPRVVAAAWKRLQENVEAAFTRNLYVCAAHMNVLEKRGPSLKGCCTGGAVSLLEQYCSRQPIVRTRGRLPYRLSWSRMLESFPPPLPPRGAHARRVPAQIDLSSGEPEAHSAVNVHIRWVVSYVNPNCDSRHPQRIRILEAERNHCKMLERARCGMVHALGTFRIA